jgi:uncharacterized membrane protein
MKSEIMKILTTMIIFTLTDYFYLNSVSGHFGKLIQTIQGSPLQLELSSTILCYFSLILGIYYFIIRENRTFIDAGILGFVIYSVFELTNKALFKKWTWYTVLIDSVWGGILFALTTYFVYKIYGIM